MRKRELIYEKIQAVSCGSNSRHEMVHYFGRDLDWGDVRGPVLMFVQQGSWTSAPLLDATEHERVREWC